ncbi:MAG: response regulator [Rhodospirillales bacterium]
MTIKVLFVDDEPGILQGLRRSLRGQRDRWDMRFCDGGAQALAEMEKDPADVVVTDMRMPGMDGAALLSEVRRRYPSSTRIILSGFAEEETVLRTVGPTHQYLNKPCDQDVLVATIERALIMRDYLHQPTLMSLVSGLSSLPALPQTFVALMGVLQDKGAGAEDLARILEKDVATTALALKLTNSAYFGLSRPVTCALDAVRLLGFDTIRDLALTAGIFAQFKGDQKVAGEMTRLSERSFEIGSLAKAIAKSEGASPEIQSHAALAGQLSHVGTLILLSEWRDTFAEAEARADAGEAIIAAEAQVFGADHGHLGAYLLGLWGFVQPIVEAVAFHHEPSAAPVQPAHPPFSALTAVHAAQALVQADGGAEQLDRTYLGDIGYAERIDHWRSLSGRAAAA